MSPIAQKPGTVSFLSRLVAKPGFLGYVAGMFIAGNAHAWGTASVSVDGRRARQLRLVHYDRIWNRSAVPNDIWSVSSAKLPTGKWRRADAVRRGIRPEEWRKFPGGLLFDKRILASKLIRTRKRLLHRLQAWLHR
jgi:hypothetical protein